MSTSGYRDKFKNIDLAVTFRDVVLLPGFTEVEPREVDIKSRPSKI